MRKLVAWTIEQAGYKVTECSDGKVLHKQLLGTGETSGFDLENSDIRMPGLSGLEAMAKARDQGVLPPTILITAFPDGETRETVQHLDPQLLAKPFEMDDLLALVSTMRPTSSCPSQVAVLRRDNEPTLSAGHDT